MIFRNGAIPKKNGLFEKYRADCDFNDLDQHRIGKSTTVPIKNISDSCFSKTREESKIAFIWGDSHAQQLYYGLSKVLPKNFELLQVASSGCVANIRAKKNNNNYCEYSNWFAYNVIRDLVPDRVIIAQNLGHSITRMNEVSFDLKRLGVKRVIFIGPTPHWTPSLPVVAARLLPDIPERTFFGVDKSVLQLDNRLKSESRNFKSFRYVSLIDYFCNSSGCLTHLESDVAASITSHDYGHLTPISSYYLSRDQLGPVVFDE